MPYTLLDQVSPIEPIPGFTARFVHSDQMSLAFWEIQPGSVLPEHSHVHEQVSFVAEGEFELTINGETTVLRPGMVGIIPSNVPHSGKALSFCKITDVFSPVREDYKNR